MRCVAILLVLVLVLGAAACGGPGGDEEQRGEGGGSREVPSQFVPGLDGAFGQVVAVEDALVGLDARARQGLPFGQVYRLSDGTLRSLEPPPAPEGLSFVASDGHRSKVLVAGYRCTGEPGDGESRCPSKVAAYLLDVADSRWTEISAPPGLDGVEFASIQHAELTADGAVAVISTSSELGPMLVRLEGTSWVQVAQDPSLEFRDACAAHGHLYALDATSEQAAGPATLHLRRFDLHTGRGRSIELPDVMSEYGGAGVTLGCNAAEAFVITSSGPDVSAGVFRLGHGDADGDGAAWERVPSELDDADVMVERAVSGGSIGPVVIAVPIEPGVGSVPQRSFAIAIDAEGKAQRLSAQAVDADVYFAGGGPTAVVVGPFTDPLPATVPVRTEVIG
jgi:hypothetical protein